MDAQLTKSLTDLIDETLLELDELRKSRFAAAEIKIEGPGDGIDGKPSDGDLHAKAEDRDEKDEDEDDEEKEEGEMDKAEDKEDDPADSDKTKRDLKDLMGKKEDKDDDKDEDDKEPHEDDPKHEEKEKKIAKKLMDMHKGEMKKSTDEMSSLMKSYVEERVKPLEDKLSTILDLVNKIADQPVAPKGVSIKAAPLFKSAEGEEMESLSKAQIASKLFDLKKSGTSVDTLDITKADLGQDLEHIVKKYKLS